MNAAKAKKSCASQTGSGWIKKDARLAVYLRDSFMCLYCMRDLRDADPFDITLDHVVSRVDGGSHKPNNIVTACRHCNCSRSDKPVSRFASPEALKQIRRNVRRSMTRYRKMAKALIAGETGDATC